MACYGPLHLSDPGKAIRSTDTSSSPCPLRGRYSSCAPWRSQGNRARPSGHDPSARLSNGFASQSCPASRAARPYRPTPRALSPVRTPAVTRQQPQPAQTRTAPDFHAARPPTGCNELSVRLQGGPAGRSRRRHGAHAGAPANAPTPAAPTPVGWRERRKTLGRLTYCKFHPCR